MLRNTVRAALAAACVLTFGHSAQAQLIASDSFDYAPGAITGQNGGSGWANSWTSSSTTNPDQVTGGGLMFAQDGATLAVSGNKLTTVGDDVGAYRRLPTASGPYGGDTNQTVWISFLAANSVDANTAGYAGLSLYDDTSSPEQFFIGQVSGTDQYGFVNQSPSNSNAAPFLTGVTADTMTHFLVTRFDFTASGSTEVSLYIDPTPGVAPMGTPQALEDYTSSFQFNQFRLQSGSSSDASFNFDELRMGSTYDDVAPAAAPEPGVLTTLALGTSALLLSALRCRRRPV